MTYTFACPTPCNNQIMVNAHNDEDAIIKLIAAGALRCRNVKYRCHCEKAKKDMSPIKEENLKQIVMTCMREAREQQEGYNGMLTPLYG